MRMRVLACALLVLLAARPASAAWVLDVAWGANADSASGSTITYDYSGAGTVTSGALLVCFVIAAHNSNGIIKSFSDDINGAWTQFGQGSPITSGAGTSIAYTGYYFLGSAAGQPLVTATYTAGVGNRGIFCGSYTTDTAAWTGFDVGSGLGQTDQGTGTNAQHTNATGTTAQANELAVSAIVKMVTTGTITAGTNVAWTERINTALGGGTPFDFQVQDFDVASPATVEGTWTFSSATADAVAMVGTFKQTAAAGGAPCLGSLLGVGCE